MHSKLYEVKLLVGELGNKVLVYRFEVMVVSVLPTWLVNEVSGEFEKDFDLGVPVVDDRTGQQVEFIR